MSITNRSVNRKASTADLNTLLSDYEGQLYAILGRPEDEIDGADVEWLESGIEGIEDELARRYDDMDTYAHDDTLSLGDSGQYLGSYAD